MRSLLQPLSRYANVLTVTLGDNFFIFFYMQCKLIMHILSIFKDMLEILIWPTCMDQMEMRKIKSTITPMPGEFKIYFYCLL